MLTYGEWPPSRHWGCRVTTDAGQVRGKRVAVIASPCRGDPEPGMRPPQTVRRPRNWSRQTSQFSGSFGNGAIWQMVRSWGPTPAAGNDGLPNDIPHASAELPSGRELLKTGRPN